MHVTNSESEGFRSLGSRHSRKQKTKSIREVRPTYDNLILKLELPTFKGGRKADPNVYIQVFENWVDMRGISKKDFISYFHCSLKGEAK